MSPLVKCHNFRNPLITPGEWSLSWRLGGLPHTHSAGMGHTGQCLWHCISPPSLLGSLGFVVLLLAGWGKGAPTLGNVHGTAHPCLLSLLLQSCLLSLVSNGTLATGSEGTSLGCLWMHGTLSQSAYI